MKIEPFRTEVLSITIGNTIPPQLLGGGRRICFTKYVINESKVHLTDVWKFDAFPFLFFVPLLYAKI